MNDKQELLNQIEIAMDSNFLDRTPFRLFTIGKSNWKIINTKEKIQEFKKKVIKNWGHQWKLSPRLPNTIRSTILEFLYNEEWSNAYYMMKGGGFGYCFAFSSTQIYIYLIEKTFIIGDTKLVVCTRKKKEHIVIEPISGLMISKASDIKKVIKQATQRIESIGVNILQKAVKEQKKENLESDFLIQLLDNEVNLF